MTAAQIDQYTGRSGDKWGDYYATQIISSADIASTRSYICHVYNNQVSSFTLSRNMQTLSIAYIFYHNVSMCNVIYMNIM